MGDPIEIPFLWLGTEDAPILFSNMQIVQHEDQEFILTFGQFVPPLAVGSPEEVEEHVRRIPHVPVKTIARIAMTPPRFEAFMQALGSNYEKWQEKQRQGKP